MYNTRICFTSRVTQSTHYTPHKPVCIVEANILGLYTNHVITSYNTQSAYININTSNYTYNNKNEHVER